MDRNERKNPYMVIVPVILYVVSVVCLFWFHPFVASAAETETTETTDTVKKNAPGGKGNAVHIYHKSKSKSSGSYSITDMTAKAKVDTEIVGILQTNEIGQQTLRVVICLEDGGESQSAKYLSDVVRIRMFYDKDGKLTETQNIPKEYWYQSFSYYEPPENNIDIQMSVSGMKIFKDHDAYLAYRENGSLDGMIKEELDSSWYLKDIRCEVTADDSPSGSGGEEATYIKFFWLTDNLEDGDLIEVKTRNYVKKIGGDKISGFHDYVTWHDNISAFDNLFNFTDKNGETSERASWTIGQKDAVKAWFTSLENKPLIFKTYETEIYYFRPVRDGTFGKWCKVTMNRFGDSGSPYIEDVEIGDMDDDGEWDRDDDLTDENGGNHGVDQGGDITTPDPDNPFEGTNIAGIFSYLFDFFKSIPSLLGDLPALVNSIIGFLPLPVIGFITAGVLIAIALRIVGR